MSYSYVKSSNETTYLSSRSVSYTELSSLTLLNLPRSQRSQVIYNLGY